MDTELLRYIESFRFLSAEQVGQIYISGHKGAQVLLIPDGSLVVGPLNSPLPSYLRFETESGEVLESDKPHGPFEILRGFEGTGLQLLRFFDPRTYLLVDHLLKVEVVHRDQVTLLVASYPMQEVLEHLKVPKAEADSLTSIMGAWYRTEFQFGPEYAEITFEDPLPSMGQVLVRFL